MQIYTDINVVVKFDTWAKQFLDLTFCRHSNASSEYSGLLRTSIGVPAESQRTILLKCQIRPQNLYQWSCTFKSRFLKCKMDNFRFLFWVNDIIEITLWIVFQMDSSLMSNVQYYILRANLRHFWVTKRNTKRDNQGTKSYLS